MSQRKVKNCHNRNKKGHNKNKKGHNASKKCHNASKKNVTTQISLEYVDLRSRVTIVYM